MRKLLTLIFIVAAIAFCSSAYGQKTRASAHGVTLGWTASASAASCVSPCVFSYNVYRGTAAGGEDMSTPINSSPVLGTAFVDANVTLGNTYFYVVEAVEVTGTLTLTSAPSNEASATFPSAPSPATGLVAKPN